MSLLALLLLATVSLSHGSLTGSGLRVQSVDDGEVMKVYLTRGRLVRLSSSGVGQVGSPLRPLLYILPLLAMEFRF